MNRRILLIDFDAATLSRWSSLLNGKGYEVVTAGTSRTVETSLRETPPALVILEPMLPGLDGFSLCRALKASKKDHPPTVIIASRIFRGQRYRGLARDAGADLFVEKPIADDLLLSMIGKFLEPGPEPVAQAAAEAPIAAPSSTKRETPAARPAPSGTPASDKQRERPMTATPSSLSSASAPASPGFVRPQTPSLEFGGVTDDEFDDMFGRLGVKSLDETGPAVSSVGVLESATQTAVATPPSPKEADPGKARSQQAPVDLSADDVASALDRLELDTGALSALESESDDVAADVTEPPERNNTRADAGSRFDENTEDPESDEDAPETELKLSPRDPESEGPPVVALFGSSLDPEPDGGGLFFDRAQLDANEETAASSSEANSSAELVRVELSDRTGTSSELGVAGEDFESPFDSDEDEGEYEDEDEGEYEDEEPGLDSSSINDALDQLTLDSFAPVEDGGEAARPSVDVAVEFGERSHIAELPVDTSEAAPAWRTAEESSRSALDTESEYDSSLFVETGSGLADPDPPAGTLSPQIEDAESPGEGAAHQRSELEPQSIDPVPLSRDDGESSTDDDAEPCGISSGHEEKALELNESAPAGPLRGDGPDARGGLTEIAAGDALEFEFSDGDGDGDGEDAPSDEDSGEPGGYAAGSPPDSASALDLEQKPERAEGRLFTPESPESVVEESAPSYAISVTASVEDKADEQIDPSPEPSVASARSTPDETLVSEGDVDESTADLLSSLEEIECSILDHEDSEDLVQTFDEPEDLGEESDSSAAEESGPEYEKSLDDIIDMVTGQQVEDDPVDRAGDSAPVRIEDSDRDLSSPEPAEDDSLDVEPAQEISSAATRGLTPVPDLEEALAELEHHGEEHGFSTSTPDRGKNETTVEEPPRPDESRSDGDEFFEDLLSSDTKSRNGVFVAGVVILVVLTGAVAGTLFFRTGTGTTVEAENRELSAPQRASDVVGGATDSRPEERALRPVPGLVPIDDDSSIVNDGSGRPAAGRESETGTASTPSSRRDPAGDGSGVTRLASTPLSIPSSRREAPREASLSGTTQKSGTSGSRSLREAPTRSGSGRKNTGAARDEAQAAVGHVDAVSAPVVKLSDLDRPLQIVEYERPVLTPEAAAAGVDGRVFLQVLIGPDGRVRDSKVMLDPGHGLGDAATRSVTGWRFTLPTQDREPVQVWKTEVVEFSPDSR